MQLFTNEIVQQHLMNGALFGFLFALGFALNSLFSSEVKAVVIRVVHGTLSGVLAALINCAAGLQLGDAAGIDSLVMSAIWGSIAGFAGFIYVQAIFDKLAKKAGLDITAARDNIVKTDKTLRELANVKSEQSTPQEMDQNIQAAQKELEQLKSGEK